MSIHEECGVFGVYSPSAQDVAALAYYGLYALQHRGQESCGIVVNDDGVFSSHKGLGLVSEVFCENEMKKFPQGEIAVGHMTYGINTMDVRWEDIHSGSSCSPPLRRGERRDHADGAGCSGGDYAGDFPDRRVE